MMCIKRIENELRKFNDGDCMGLDVKVQNPKEWIISFPGTPGSIYEGENFSLKVKFSAGYPIESPEVTFLQPPPIHPHIYSNGHICLNILGDDWSPALTVKSICLSIISMLCSATEKIPPIDNERYSRIKGVDSNPKHTKFIYHDDRV